MKRSLFLAVLMVGLISSAAMASTINVSSNPLWTDTGINLSGETVTITYIDGTWTWQTPRGPFTATGDNQPTFTSDEWIQNGQHMQLIGYVGSGNPNTETPSRIVSQNDPSLFVIGNGTTISGLTGELWLGANDDYATLEVADNNGSLNVNVNVVPVPAAAWLLGSGLIGLVAIRRRMKK